MHLQLGGQLYMADNSDTGRRLDSRYHSFDCSKCVKTVCFLEQKRPPSVCMRIGIHVQEQEAQLCQRGRAMLRVVEYFPKSLKVN